MTASIPQSFRSGPYIVGMPPPPAQMTTVPFSRSHFTGRISKIRFGRGDGTTRRKPSPSGLKIQPFSAAIRSASSFAVDRTDRLRRVPEGRVRRVDLGHREDRGEGALEREEVPHLLLDDVADHPLGLRAEDVERVRLDARVGRLLEGEEPHLRAVAVRDDDLVVVGDRRERLAGPLHVGPLVLGRHRLSALQEGVPAQGDDDAHRASPSRRASRRGRP